MTQSEANIVVDLLENATRHPHKSAVISGSAEVSYGDLVSSIRSRAAFIQASGIAAGNRVGVVTRDPLEDLLVRLAVTYLDGVPCAINPETDPATRAAMIELYGLNVLFEADDCFSSLPQSIRMDARWRISGSAASTAEVGRSDMPECQMILTSGTTGTPSAVIFSRSWYRLISYNFTEEGLLNRETVFLSQSPHFTNAGTMLPLIVLMAGGTVILRQAQGLESIVAIANDYDISLLFLPPQFASALVQLAQQKDDVRLLPKVESILVGSDFCPPELLDDILHYLSPRAFVAYGSSTCGLVSILHQEEAQAKAGSVGNASPGVKIQIVDNDDREVPRETVGRIRIRTPIVPLEVIGPAKFNGEEIKDGWVYPGDIGRLDEDGFLFVMGRESDVFHCMGKAIYPVEIERCLAKCPDLAEVVVAGVPAHEDTYPVVFATGNASLTAAQLAEFAASAMGPASDPLKYAIIDAIPRNPAGKALKRDLVASYQAGRFFQEA
jgi:acyl-CoA synthetase (AMP-forming)/AMP-acid ligase II